MLSSQNANIEFQGSYYEWDLIVNGELVYTFGDGISETVSDNTKMENFKDIVEMYVDGIIEELEEAWNEHISAVRNNKKEIISKMLEVWAKHFGIED